MPSKRYGNFLLDLFAYAQAWRRAAGPTVGQRSPQASPLSARRAQETGGTHFKVRITSSRFEGLTAVRRHQLVYGLLGDQFRDGLHALNIVARTPAEDAAAAAAGKPP